MKDKSIGHCILCHKDDVELSKEHVIPQSMGGYYCINNVCKECNSSILGAKVDPMLINHIVVQLMRYSQKLQGYKGSIPSPFAKPEQSSDGTKYYVTEDKDGKLTPKIQIIPKYKYTENGQVRSFTLSFNVEDRKKADKIVKRILEKNEIDKSKVVKEEKMLQKKVTLKYQFDVPLKDFYLGILKIAYEYTCDCIHNYEKSPNGQQISSILSEANPKRIDEISISNNVKDTIEKIFGDYIDFSASNRHYLFLLQCKDKLICVVNLYLTFCIGFIMNEKIDRNYINNYVLINDIEKHRFEKFSLEELITKVSRLDETSFVFSKKQYKGSQKLKDLDRTNKSYKKNHDGYVILMNSKYPIGTMPEYLSRLDNKDIKSTVAGNWYTTRYFLPKGVFVMQESTEELIPIDEIQIKSKITKY